MSELLVELKNLKTHFFTEEGTVKAVDGVDLKIYKGEILGLVGESGCGKSTIALSLLRLVPKPGQIADGEIVFEGTDILGIDEEEMRNLRGGDISIIWQDPMSSLNPVYTIGDQISESIILHQDLKDKDEIMEKVYDILEKVGIPDSERRAKQYPHEFSGGMRQRVMIAMALSCNPKLLIADEPTTSLDVTIQAQILDLMEDLTNEFDASVLVITHDLGVVAEMADKVAVMYAGKIVEYSDVITVFKNPFHPYTKALLNSIPRVDIEQGTLESIEGMVPDLISPPKGCRFNPRCQYVMEICRKEEPQLHEVESDHIASCFLFTQEGKVETQ
jgi:oligopeptide/dipeptide ABC transporter ATP-binding protein